jgi:2-octaprenyl-6-methoxyphenol hydroxylase
VKSVDVVVVGGGIVGTVLAKGLSEQAGLKVTLVDAADPKDVDTQKGNFNPFTDTRVIALARRTVNELAQLGIDVDSLSKQLHGEAPPNIHHIEVSDKGHIGLVDLHCNDYYIDAFGQVVSLGALTHLAANMGNHYDTIAPASVHTVSRFQHHTEVLLENGEVLQTKLLVLADGGRSALADQVGITKDTVTYQQTAVVFNVHTQLPHNNKAYERFTESGPLAFLPFDSQINAVKATANGFSVVWTVSAEDAAHLLSLGETEFADKLQAAFGYRQGKILRISEKASYPLALTRADQVAVHRSVVVGNAAQALHPIAGQGFNLGLRDIITLVDVLKDAKRRVHGGQIDAGAFAITNAYAAMRQSDRDKTIRLTDTLVRTFSNGYLPTVIGRNMALLTLNMLPNAKKAFVRQTTGYAEYQKHCPDTSQNSNKSRENNAAC